MVAAAHSRFRVALVLPAMAIRFIAAVVPAALGDVDFAAEDRLDVALAGFVEEIGSREKIAVVGDGHGRHLLARRFVEQLGSFAGTVEQAEIGVHVQMYELGLSHELDSKALSRDLHYAI